MFRRAVLSILKIAFLSLILLMAWMQVPEMIYDFGNREPVEIRGPEDLDAEKLQGTVFAVVRGTPDFSDAFVYRRYGLDHHYFIVDPYGTRLVVRTYERITDDWRKFTSFVGRLRPFDEQPFSRYVAAIYRDRFDIRIPGDAFFLALDDVPEPSGWQIGGLVLSAVIFLGLLWLFFLKGKILRKPRPSRP